MFRILNISRTIHFNRDMSMKDRWLFILTDAGYNEFTELGNLWGE